MISSFLQIPILKIRPNANNPRHVITQDAVDKKVASLKANGQETPIKVRPLAPEERTASPGIDYELIGGHLRLLAAQKLGWESLTAQVLDGTPEEIERAALVDNKGEDMHWLDWDRAMERMMATDPQLTQQDVADRLEFSQKTVSKALKLLSLLSSSAREAIYTRGINLETNETIGEKAVFPLTELADPQKVEAALNVVLDRKMTEATVKKLVAWVQAGNSPKSFPEDGKLSGQKGSKQQRFDPADPNAELWKGLPKSAKIHKTPKGYKLTWNLSETEAPTVVAGALARLNADSGVESTHPSHGPRLEVSVQGPPHIEKINHKLKTGQKLNLQESLSLAVHGSETVLVPVAKSLTHLGFEAGRKLLKLGEKEVKKESREEKHHSRRN